MPVKLTVDNKSTDHFQLIVDFDIDALEKIGPCRDPGVEDLEGDELIAFLFKRWCDHKASDWFSALEKASLRVELAEAADSLGAEVFGPELQAVDEE